MANCQNNMRYGRQMNFNSGFRNMPANDNSGCRNMPVSNNNGCRNMPSEGKHCRPAPAPMPKADCGCRIPEPCECKKPEPCECQKPEPCECRKPELRECRKPESCECRHDALEDFPLAMAYVPWQKWQNVCDACKGFQKGTIFEDLSKPFHGKGGCNR